MDVWVVAAAAGAGYVAQHLKNLTRVKHCFSDLSSINANFYRTESSPSIREVQDKSCPFRSVLLKKKLVKDDYREETKASQEASSAEMASTSGLGGENMVALENLMICSTSCNSNLLPGFLNNEDVLEDWEGRGQNIDEVYSDLWPQLSAREMGFSYVVERNRSRLRTRRSSRQFIKPLTSLESCLMAQLYKEHLDFEEYTFSSTHSPHAPTARPFVVTDGSRIISRQVYESFSSPTGTGNYKLHKSTYSHGRTQTFEINGAQSNIHKVTKNIFAASKLNIPDAWQMPQKLSDIFVEAYKHELSNVVKLTDRVGHVRLVEEGVKLWLHRGWDKLFQDHSIEYGYDIVFKYIGNSSFKVHIFDLTGNEFNYLFYNSRKFKETNYHPRNSIPEREEQSDDDYVTILDSLPTELVASPLRSVAPNGRVVQSRRDEKRSYRGRKSDLGKKAVHNAGTSLLTYPSFTVEMKSNLTPKWYVPAQFAREHLPYFSGHIELHDSNGKKWPVDVNIRHGLVRYLSWVAFTKAKKIKVGDVYVFEIIHSNEPVVLKVSILR